MITTTLERIRSHGPCAEGWEKLLAHLGKTKADDDPLPYAVIVESNGLDDALWCCIAEPQHEKEWRLYAVWCARHVQHLMTDQRSIHALDAAERYANGNATDKELTNARNAARNAVRDVIGHVAWAAALATSRAVSWSSTWAPTWVVAGVAEQAAALAAVGDVTWAEARAAERATQTEEFLRVVG